MCPKTFIPVKDITDEVGNRRWICCGDIHGCSEEFHDLMDKLEFDWDNDVLISVGDLCDRGPYSDIILGLLLDGKVKRFYGVQGNHDDKLIRYCRGNKVQISHGIDRTLNRICSSLNPNPFDYPEIHGYFKDLILHKLAKLPLILKVKDTYVVHAGFRPDRSVFEQYKSDCLYMRFHGGSDYFDEVNGKYWANLWNSEKPTVFMGHSVMMCDYIRYRDNGSILTCNLDGGCVFGGELRAYDSKDGLVHTVPANFTYSS